MKNRLEFNAGILKFDPATKKVTADKRLGKIQVFNVNFKIF
jgi:hypothetical protein